MVRVHFGPPLRKAKVKSKSEKWRSNLFTIRYYLLLQIYGGLAQLGERLPCKQEVSGSIPLISTKKLTDANKSESCYLFHWVSWETQNAPWKLNIEVIMMQLWEQQLREIFYNWVIIQFCKYLLLMSLHNSTNLRTKIGLFSVSWLSRKTRSS